MRTIREAIDNGVKAIYCNSGLTIELPDLYGRRDEGICVPKIIQGKPVYRWLFVRLHGAHRPMVNVSAIKHRSEFYEDLDYCYFHSNEFIAREKEVNELISDNGGINEYYTNYYSYN